MNFKKQTLCGWSHFLQKMVCYSPDSANWKRALHDPVLLVLVAYLIITEFDCPFITDGVSYNISKITILSKVQFF